MIDCFIILLLISNCNDCATFSDQTPWKKMYVVNVIVAIKDTLIEQKGMIISPGFASQYNQDTFSALVLNFYWQLSANGAFLFLLQTCWWVCKGGFCKAGVGCLHNAISQQKMNVGKTATEPVHPQGKKLNKKQTEHPPYILGTY